MATDKLRALEAELSEAALACLLPVQTTRLADAAAFERLLSLADALADELRGSEVLPRRAVNLIYTAAKALQNEAPYAQQEELIAQWAAKLFMTFDLIMLGQSHADRAF
jgi:hypothetical protein